MAIAKKQGPDRNPPAARSIQSGQGKKRICDGEREKKAAHSFQSEVSRSVRTLFTRKPHPVFSEPPGMETSAPFPQEPAPHPTGVLERLKFAVRHRRLLSVLSFQIKI